MSPYERFLGAIFYFLFYRETFAVHNRFMSIVVISENSLMLRLSGMNCACI